MKRRTTLEVTSAIWQNRGLLFITPHSNGNLVAIHGQKYICGSSEIPVGAFKTLVELKAEKDQFEKGLCPGVRLANGGPGYRLRNIPGPCELSCSSVWLWSCHELCPPRDPGGVMPPCASGNRPADLDTVPVPWSRSGPTYLRDLPAGTFVHVHGNRPADLGPTVDLGVARGEVLPTREPNGRQGCPCFQSKARQPWPDCRF